MGWKKAGSEGRDRQPRPQIPVSGVTIKRLDKPYLGEPADQLGMNIVVMVFGVGIAPQETSRVDQKNIISIPQQKQGRPGACRS